MRATTDDGRLLSRARRLKEEAHALLYGEGLFDLASLACRPAESGIFGLSRHIFYRSLDEDG